MTKVNSLYRLKTAGDLVLKEVWRSKDMLSDRYDHDLDRLFAETRTREKQSGHPLVRPPRKGRKA